MISFDTLAICQIIYDIDITDIVYLTRYVKYRIRCYAHSDTAAFCFFGRTAGSLPVSLACQGARPQAAQPQAAGRRSAAP